MTRVSAGGVVAVIALATPAIAHAQVDAMERAWGATNVNGALGDGHLAVGVARTGEVTVLRWPGPASPDHVRYKTESEAPDGGSARTLPYFGAGPDMGFFAGVVLDGGTSWLRDWPSTQVYANEDSPVLVTTYTHGPMTVVQRDFVVWQQDVLVRRLSLSGLSGPARVVAYGALAPCSQRTSEAPLDDWFYDVPAGGPPLVDFALFYSPEDGALVQFRPRANAVDSLLPAAATAVAAANASPAAAAAEVAALDGTFGAGFYFAWGGSQAPAQETAATMAYPGRPDAGPPPAYDDATAGALSGGEAALAPASGALAFDLTPDGGAAALDLFLAAGSGAGAALSALRSARAQGAASLQAYTEQGWRGLLSGLTMPRTGDARMRFVARRAIMTIVTATDAPSGAIVASITTQPPYAQDWPRDSTFISAALDQAGLPDRATANLLFIASCQRTTSEPGEPAGSYAMNEYPDCRPGGPIAFEIDQTALTLWAFETHAEWLESIGRDVDASRFRAQVYPAAERTADLLVACKDPATGLQCLANEDDDPVETQSLDGAITVFMGMQAATRLAAAQGQAADEAAWSARAGEIKAAILAHLVDDAGFLVGGSGERGWALWPAGLFDGGDPRIDREADVLLDGLTALATGETAGSAYDAKETDALAVVLRGDPARLGRLDSIVTVLLDDVPTATGHYGEAYVTIDGGVTPPVFEDVTAIPHVWEASINYLSAILLYGPQPPAAASPEETVPERGCGGCAAPGAAPLGALLLSSMLLRRGRRTARRAQRGPPAGGAS